MDELTFHPAANIFPMMTADEYAGLVNDIAEHGQREPILTYCGQIIDGRNRYKACVDLGLKPDVNEWAGDESELLAYIISLNLHRRHLNESQRAIVAAKVANMPNGRPSKTVEISTVSQGDAAAMFNVSRASVNTAAKILHEAADAVIDAVEQGFLPVSAAAKIVDAPPDFQADVARRVVDGTRPQEAIRQTKAERIAKHAPAEPTGKYRIIYADPPWSYGNTQPDYHPEQRDHYPVMPLADICALPVKDLAEDNAVLFLWVTSPILEEAFQVVKAWGFQYKTSFVWDKVKHNMGHYNSVRHELLLVCTRGSCTPDAPRLFDSVVTEERTEHSVKPETFRTIIDTIYPHGERIELFARAAHDGWQTWGLEA